MRKMCLWGSGLVLGMVFVSSLARTVTANDGPAMLPILGQHARCAACGYTFIEPATYPNIGDVFHPGWDMNLSVPNDDGEPVYAIADGTVVDAETNPADEWGSIVIEHDVNGTHFYSQYGHCSKIYLVTGAEVKMGAHIATVGAIGATDPDGTRHPHLHWEIRMPSPVHPNPTNRNYFGGPGTPNYLATESNVTASYRDPELFVVHLDADDERASQGTANYGTLQQDIHWYHAYNPNELYRSGGVPNNCYVQNWGGGAFSICGIVYDALGGARRSYTVRTAFWQNGQGGLGRGWANQGGPTSWLGMPITNEHETNPNTAEQYFVDGWYRWAGAVESHYWTVCGPGWSEVGGEGWKGQYSYLFADAFDRNGVRPDVGEPTNKVHVLDGNILIQDFSGGNDGAGMIMYDMQNWNGNECATNEAYWVYGGIKNYYDNHGAVGRFGCATVDQFQYQGRWCQDFKNSKHQLFRIFESGSPRVTGLSPCVPGVHAAGPPTPVTAYDFDGDGKADVWDRTSTGEFHLDYATNGFGGWEWTGYGYGGSQDTPAPADYDGDGRCDIAVLRNSDGKWLMDFASNDFGAWDDSLCGYGSASDYPCPGDFDGDGIADLSVRDADGDWHIDYFAQGTGFGAWDTTFYGYGGQYDRPAPADYDGDGKCDFAILRNSDHKYIIDYAVNGFGSWDETNLGGYGGYADYPCPADYDNDGSDDIAVLNTGDRVLRVDRTGNGFNGWDYVLGGYGGSGDRPMPADYDGDGWHDIATFYAAYDQICLDYASNNYGSWDFCDDGPDHPTWKRAAQTTVPLEYSVAQNYPNPFNASTVIGYTLPEACHVKINVLNILGQRIETLVDQDQDQGRHQLIWNAQGFSSGIYFYRVQTPSATEVRKMVLTK